MFSMAFINQLLNVIEPVYIGTLHKCCIDFVNKTPYESLTPCSTTTAESHPSSWKTMITNFD